MTHEITMESLRVLVPADLILDGMVEFPQVGDRVEYALTFVELEPDSSRDAQRPHRSSGGAR